MDGADIFEGSEKLVGRFGYWPSFHDAEILELVLDRGKVVPDKASYVFPILTVKAHVFEMTDKVNPSGYFVLTKHTLVTLRFYDIEDCELVGFNHQNAILGLTVSEADAGARRSPVRMVRMEGAHGLDATFKCSRCEVMEALPCDEHGVLPPNTSLERTREG